MARSKGSANFAGSLEVLAGAPLDARTVVNVKADLTDSQSYTYVYVGMIVSVKSEGKAYILTAADFTDSNNWSELGSGGSGTGGVVEGYFNPTDDLFYEESTYETAITGESGILYVSLDTNRLYRFNGTIFVVVSDLDATVYQPAGSVLFANLPAASAGTLGFVYDIQDDFVTTSDFIEGAGKAYSAGTNVVVINHGTSSLPIYKYDVLSGRANLPTGGTTGQALVKHSNSDGDVEWATIKGAPAGGTTGQVLGKSSNTDYDISWGDPYYYKYEEKTLGVNNFTYNNGNLVNDGETKIFHSYWPAGTTSGQNAGLPDTDIANWGRHYYIEMTKSADGTSFVQRCRKFYTVTNTNYFKMYNRRCEKNGNTWTYSDWIEFDATAMLPVTPNQFDKANMYSTTEKVVGCWTDGRPLYQKTINTTTAAKDSSKTIDTISNIDLKYAYGYAVNGTYKVPITWSMGDNFCYVYQNGSNIIIQNGSESAYASIPAYITIQYTKTTDAANSFNYASENDYSTSEKIVGTWIDGKPLYQKTIDTGALPNATTKNTAHSISNLKAVISVRGAAKNPTTGANITIPWASASPKYVYAIVNSTNVEIGTGDNRSAFTSSYVTIQYTKTTD